MMKKILVYLCLATAFVIQAYSQIQWEKDPNNPVLRRGSNGLWDDIQVGSPTVIYDGALYHMWYNGNDGSNTNIGYASSTDKINWEKHPTPVLEHGSSGSWDDLYILHPTVYFDGTTYHMWYTGTNGSVAQIGYATSPDSVNWTKYSGNPVLKPGESGSWDDQNVNSPEVLFIGGVFHMWYGGFDGSHEQTGHATSLNGIDWEKDTLNPVLKVGDPGGWDNANSTQPSVLFDGTYFYMWYGGGQAFSWKIGYAYSEDGRNWRKDETNNPVLGPGLSGNWDSKYVGYQDVCFNSDSTGFDMWYTAGQSAAYVGDIGFATTDTSDLPPVVVNAQNTTLIGRWQNDPSYSFYTVDISGNYAYIISSKLSNTPSNSDLNIIDISDPSSPQLVGFVNELKDTRGISINGNYAYLAAEHGCCAIYGELIIIDISNPSSPQDLGYVGLAGYGAGLGVVNNGNYAYVVSSDGGLNAFNISTPSSPLLWGAYWPPTEEYPDPHYEGLGIDVSGSYAYIANGDSGLRIIDVSSPANMEEVVGRYETGGHAADVAVNGNYVYMADGEKGLRIIDVSTPSAPQEVGSLDTDGFAKDVTLIGSYAYVADGQNGLRIIDVTTPSLPQEVGFFNTGGYAAGIVVNGSYAYIADRDSGLYIIHNDLVTNIFEELGEGMPKEYALFQNYPNPFNPTTKIRYYISDAGLVSIRVYNLIGEVVATLVNEEKPVGTYELSWDAENLPSGVYFYQLKAGNFVETKKMLLLK